MRAEADAGATAKDREDGDGHPPDLVFVADPEFGMEGGVRTFESLGRVLFKYEDLLPTIVEDRTLAGRVANVIGRAIKGLFIDVPLADLEVTTIHEVFGHGARAREFGEKPTYQFLLPSPYVDLLSQDTGVGGTTQTSTRTGTRDRDLAVTAAGLEANYLTAWWIDAHVVAARGWAHHGEMLVYLGSKLAYRPTFFSEGLRGRSREAGDDIDEYIASLQDRFNRWTPSDRASIARKLQTAYAWNLVDPTLFFSVYAGLFRPLVGEPRTKMPLPTVGKTTFYATPRFGLSPFGAEHYVDLFVARGSWLAALYGRVGTSGLASYSGGGLQVFGIEPHPSLSLGFGMDAWTQPQILLHDRNVYDRPNVGGLNVSANGTVAVVPGLGITGKLAWKTSGYLAGQPLEEGVYGYAGVSIATR